MNLIQPWMLWLLPLAALPIIIHLINQRRFQTVDWAAMHFLLAANKMNRGFAKLRQWLILAARTLAILALIFAIARPLSDGWLGLAVGNRVDTTFVLLDRSPSMSESGPGGMTKLATGRQRLVDTLNKIQSNRFVLIDSRSGNPIEFEKPEDLLELPQTGVSAASVDLPAMLQATADYVRDNRPGRAEVWICSDVRRNDWDDADGRWGAIRSSFAESTQAIRFHLLAYTQSKTQNRSVRVTQVRRIERDGVAQLLVSMKVRTPAASSGDDDSTTTVPIRLTIDGARSEFNIEMQGNETEVKDHVVPLDASQKRGWGSVAIPSDENSADNTFYFAFDEPVERRTLVVADNVDEAQPLVFASSITPDASIVCSSQAITPDQFASTAIDETALILWHADLPTGQDAELIEWFATRGGKVIFYPPESPTDDEIAGVNWDSWVESPEGLPVSTWTGDQDLLGNVRSGAALPVGTLKVKRHCQLGGKHLPLAMLNGGKPLLSRAVTDQRNLYFCTTTVAPSDSSMARDGVVLYAMIQRAVSGGAESLGDTREITAGLEIADSASEWKRIAGDGEPLSTAFTQHAGVYESNEKLFAVNRSEAEDDATIVPQEKVASLFEGLDFDRVDDVAGSDVTLIQEIWQLLMWVMMAALFVEAILCIPRKPAEAAQVTGTGTAGAKRAVDLSGFDDLPDKPRTPTDPSAEGVAA